MSDYDRVSRVLADLDLAGYDTPTSSTVRRWANDGKIRAYRVGSDRLLVSRVDVQRMCTPIPVGAA
jgi:hypothetical protein